MRGAGRSALPSVLLIVPENLIRGTVASVCRDLGLAQVKQAISVAQGERVLMAGTAEGVVLSLSDVNAALSMLERLRAGAFGCDANLPVAVLAHECTPDLAARLKSLDVKRLLLQPFRLRDVIHTLEKLWPEHEQLAA